MFQARSFKEQREWSDARKERFGLAYRVSVVIEKDGHGYYAFSPEIEGCQTQGASLEEVVEHVRKTIEQYLEPYAAAPVLKMPA
jgi:predicted RNase H-like HicB family nuclease